MARKYGFSVFGVALLAVLTGCASSDRRIDEVPIATSPTDNPAEQIQELEARLQKAREHNVHLLSPTWFASADKSVKEARKLRDEGGDFKDLFKHVAEGRAQITRAEEFAAASQKMLPEVFQARNDAWEAEQKAREAGATNLEELHADYKKVDARLIELTTAVEDNDLKKVENNRGEVILAYRILTTRALKKQKLDTALRVLEEAKRLGAEDHAPRSYQVAKQSIDSAEKFISTSPNVGDAVDLKAKEAMFYANRALVLTKEALAIDNSKPEEVALATEAYLSQIGSSLGVPDRRDRPFQEQSAMLRQYAQERASTSSSKTAQNDKLRSTLAEVSQEAEQSREEADQLRAREDLFKDVSQRFTANEAEVIRRGDAIILRMRGIQFPVGESRLGPENFALLGKVKQAIEQFPTSAVTVEGHTDTSGSNKTNNLLSTQRAEAVREYLASSGAARDGKISSVGLGSTRPIESNKAAAGRAANRRIDIVIASGGVETPASDHNQQ